MNCSLPGSSVHGILQARVLEWVAIPLSRESFQPRDRMWVSWITGKFIIIWTTREAPRRQEPFPIWVPAFEILRVSFLNGRWHSTLPQQWNGKGNGNPLRYCCLGHPMTEEPGRLQSMGLHGVRHNWAHTHPHTQQWKPCWEVHEASISLWICNLSSYECFLLLTLEWVTLMLDDNPLVDLLRLPEWVLTWRILQIPYSQTNDPKC